MTKAEPGAENMIGAKNINARVAVLLDHAGVGDSRMIHAAQAMAAAGCTVRVFTLDRGEQPSDEPELSVDSFFGGGADTMTKTSVFLPEATIIPIPKTLIAILRSIRRALFCRPASPSSAVAPALHAEPDDSPIAAEPVQPGEPTGAIAAINRVLGAMFWHRAVTLAYRAPVTHFAPNIIHAHDLSTLGAGALIARECGAKLIYDAHEYERGRNGVLRGLAENIRRSFEARYIYAADSVVTVSESIADRLARLYVIARPTVIPNAAPLNDGKAVYTRAEFGIPDTQRLALYVGSFQKGRGLEPLIQALPQIPNLHFALAGHACERRTAALRKLAIDMGVSERVTFILPVPSDHVSSLIQIADLSVIPIQNSCVSYELCLPNKLFQSLAANVPVVSTPLPEITAVLSYFGGGVIAAGFDAPALAEALAQNPSSATQKAVDLHLYNLPESQARYANIVSALVNGKRPEPTPPLPHWTSDAAKSVAQNSLQLRAETSWLSAALSIFMTGVMRVGR